MKLFSDCPIFRLNLFDLLRDLLILNNQLVGRDATCLRAPVPDFSADLETPIKGLRVGLIRECFEQEVLDPAVKASSLMAP